MNRSDCLEARWVILSNVRTDSSFTYFRFWWTFHLIGENNDQICFLGVRWVILSDILNGLQLDLILINLSCELGQIMTRYDFPRPDGWFWTMLEQTPILVNLVYECGQIMTRYDFLDEWFWAMFELTFGTFSVARKPIINGGAIRPLVWENGMKCKRAHFDLSTFKNDL